MKTSIPLLSVLVAIGLSSCQSPSGVVEGQPKFSNYALTHHRKDIVLRDIPLPELFAMTEDSFCHGTGSFRYGEFSYEGTVSLDEVFEFYKKQMRFNRWNEGSVRKLNDNSARLAYSKGSEACTILIRENVDNTDLKIIVEQTKS